MLSDDWVKAMEKEGFYDAMATGIAIYLVMRQKQDRKLADAALALVHPAISSPMTEGATLPGDAPQQAITP